jgi:hypothetical protein
MSKIALEGNASGTGTFTVAAPNSNSNFTLTLPVATGTVVVTGGAQTIEFAAGSSSAPSITFTSDTNTGIFSPAADTIAFAEGGVEAMRIDSSGNVGIGTSSPSFKVDVIGSSTPTLRIDDGAASGTRVAGRLLLGATSTLGVAIENNVVGFNDVCSMVFKTTAAAGSLTERMRIDSSGNVLIGSTSTAGTTNPTAITVAGRLRSTNGQTASIANGATADISLTMPRVLVAYIFQSNANSAHMSAGFFRSNDNGASSTFTLFGQSQDSISVTSPSAGTIRVTNSTGGSAAFNYTFTVIAGL